ncbi:MAG TPA: GUN4 domain-containing protein, partial [Allocoleopsis sp.]
TMATLSVVILLGLPIITKIQPNNNTISGDRTQKNPEKEKPVNKFSKLENYLKNQDWKQADIETISLFSPIYNINNFTCEEMKTIESLWVQYSQGKFGLNIQKQIYFETGNQQGISNRQTWGRFADQVGWRVNGIWLENYNVLTLSLNAPKGHLPAFAGQKGNVNQVIIDRAITCGI